MAFRQPQEQEQGVPSLGYRLSSNRQQGGHPNMSQFGYPMPNSGMFGDLMGMRSSMMEALPMAYVPGDDYGSYIGDSVLGMDELGGQYDPMDEYEFDKDLFDFRIRTPGLDDIMPNYNRGGIASLRR